MTTHAQLLTEHFDIWSAAVAPKAAAGRGSNHHLELYGIKKLRELILELAVRGLLVPQDPHDEPAAALLKQISAERKRLSTEEGLRTEASDVLSGKCLYIKTPECWGWCRLGNLTKFIDYRGKTPKKIETGVRLITAKNVRFGYIDINPEEFISEEEYQSWMTRGFPRVGDLVFTTEAPLGNVAIINLNEKFALAQRTICFQLHIPKIAEFLKLAMMSKSFQEQISLQATGMTATGIKASKLKEIPVPIPPLAEQRRIVAKVDELMALCDRLEQQQDASIAAHQTLVRVLLAALTSAAERGTFEAAWTRIADHFDALFTTAESVGELKQTILQLAVMGKLVPQDPADEPAAILLKKIAAEKAKLVKEGKIKKQEPLPPIRENEQPFALPDGWEWCRWNDIALKIGDIDHKMPDNVENGIPYVSPRDFYPNNVINFDDAKKVSREDFERLAQKIRPEKGDIIFPRYGTIGANVLVNTDREFLASYSCCVIKTLQGYIDSDYQFIYSISNFVTIQCRNAENKTTQANVGIKSIQEFVVPVPPLKEQHRIVAKVDELMALCDGLHARLAASQTTQRQLADAMTAQAVGNG